MTASTKNFQMPTAENPKVKNKPTQEIERDPSEEAIDQGVEESFPASDPVAVSVTKIERTDETTDAEKGRAGST